VPVPALPWTKWSDVGPLLVGAVGIILVSPTDTIAAATNFAFRRGDEVDSDQEMVGIGTSNIAAGFFQGFAVSVGGCRAAMVDQSGARTQLTGLVGAGLVAVLLLFLNGLLVDLPQTALASVAITAALSLMDLGVLRRYAQVRTSALTVSLVAAVGVILLGVLQGIIVAIVLAILSFFRRNWWPHGTVLGEVPEMGGWYGTVKYPGATQLPAVVVFRREAPLFFANSGQFRDKVRRLARERPLPGSFCSARWSLTSMSLPPKCSRLWMRSSMIAACIRHSSSHAIASRTWCAAMASTPRWTESTSIPASTRPSMRSTMRPRTALCRPMKGCRLHEHRP
jgi:MFS superfamily sulfate permease-like transporter